MNGESAVADKPDTVASSVAAAAAGGMSSTAVVVGVFTAENGVKHCW